MIPLIRQGLSRQFSINLDSVDISKVTVSMCVCVCVRGEEERAFVEIYVCSNVLLDVCMCF